MQNPKKILIFTSKTGGGHISLSDALRDWLATDFQVETLDPQPGFIHWHYRMVSRHALWLWALEFRSMDTPARSRFAHALSSRGLFPYVARALRQYEPDAVLSTYPFLTSEVLYAMRKIGRVRPFGMLFADPNGVHHSWLSETGATLALAPTRETYAQAEKEGFRTGQLFLSGWPVRAQFYREALPSRQAIFKELGLENGRFTVFLQGGGEGAARFAATVEAVHQIQGVQIILAAGTNQVLLEKFRGKPKIAALGFTKAIGQYMAAADVVMGKAGPNMLMESVSLGRPFIATAYIPGQEQANLAFIERHGLGWVALDGRSQRELIERLARNPTGIETMNASVAEYRAWNLQATTQIPGLVRAMLENRLPQ
jgi:UDP-N-acetylglucosamine:LPS N-acetylglucosamine transferase